MNNYYSSHFNTMMGRSNTYSTQSIFKILNLEFSQPLPPLSSALFEVLVNNKHLPLFVTHWTIWEIIYWPLKCLQLTGVYRMHSQRSSKRSRKSQINKKECLPNGGIWVSNSCKSYGYAGAAVQPSAYR